MSRTPVLDRTIATMAQLALDSGESLPPDLTPDQAATAYLLSFTENGGRLSQLALQLGVSRFLLQRWIWGDAERKQSYARARADSSHALVDEGGDLLDSATRDTIAVANARAGWRKWLASKYDPQTYGEGTHGTVVLGDLHLHALQGRRVEAVQPLAPPTPSIQLSPPSNGSHTGAVERGYPTEQRVEIHTKAPPSAPVGE